MILKILKKSIILVIVIFILYLTNITSLIYGATIYPFLEKPFVSKTWKSADAIERGYMYEDLLGSTNNLTGKSREEIVKLLGQPDKDKSVMCYDIGPLTRRFGFMPLPNDFCIGFKGNYVSDVFVMD